MVAAAVATAARRVAGDARHAPSSSRRGWDRRHRRASPRAAPTGRRHARRRHPGAPGRSPRPGAESAVLSVAHGPESTPGSDAPTAVGSTSSGAREPPREPVLARQQAKDRPRSRQPAGSRTSSPSSTSSHARRFEPGTAHRECCSGASRRTTSDRRASCFRRHTGDSPCDPESVSGRVLRAGPRFPATRS